MLVVSMLVIFGAVGAGVLSIAAARLRSVDTLQRRLESTRLARAYEDGLLTAAITAAETDASIAYPANVPLQPAFWDSAAYSVDPDGGFPETLLTEPRQTGPSADRDPFSPGSLPWFALFSETVRAHATAHFSRNVFSSSGRSPDIAIGVAVEPALCRIPAAAVGLVISQQPAAFEFPVDVDGPVVLIPDSEPLSLPSNLVCSASLVFARSPRLKITAGADVRGRIFSVYGLHPSAAPAADRSLDSVADASAGIANVMINGQPFLGIDLGTYNGPSALSIHGSATARGFVVIGAPDASRRPVSIAVEGPLILAGSNARYVLAATASNVVTIYSGAHKDIPTGTWLITGTATTPATSTRWLGHVFVAAPDPTLRLEENWASSTLTLRGSLHLLGGTFRQGGQGAGTLGTLYIRQPASSEIGLDPLGGGVRHESFVACPSH